MKIFSPKLKYILTILTGIILGGFWIQDAYAYIDPGTGTIIIQALIGALVGVAITLKIYWYKLKEKLSGVSKKK